MSSTVETEKAVTVLERPSGVAETAVYDEKMRVIDATLTACRQIGYCHEAVRMLEKVFGESPWSNGEWYDANGFDLYGYGQDGFSPEGYDRDGYNRDGYSDAGFNREGFNRDGFNRYGCNAEGLDIAGNRVAHWCDTCKRSHHDYF